MDRIAEAYFGKMGQQFMLDTRKRVHWICENTSGESVLDIGCSQGICDILLAREGFRVLGVDLDTEAIAYANESLTNEGEIVKANLSFLNSDFASLKLTEKYDTIIISEIIEHLLQPELLLEFAKENIKENGSLIVTLPFGVNDYYDHKKTYFLEEAYSLLDSLFCVKEIVLFGKWIGFLCKNSEEASVEVSTELRGLIEKELEDRERAYQTTISNLKDTNSKQRESITKVERQHALDAEMIQGLEKEKDNLSSKVAELDCIIKEKVKELEESGTIIATKEAKINELKKMIDDNKSAMEKEHQIEISKLSQEIQDKSWSIKELEDIKTVNSNKIQELEDEIIQKKRAYDDELAKIYDEYKISFEYMETVQSKSDNYIKALLESKSEINKLNNCVKALQTDNAKATKAASELPVYKEKVTELEKENRKLLGDIVKLSLDSKKYLVHSTIFESERKDHLDMIARLETEQKGYVDAIEKNVSEIKAHLDRIAKLEKEQKGYLEAISKLEEEHKKYLDTIKSLEAEKKEYIKSIDRLNTEKRINTETIQNLSEKQVPDNFYIMSQSRMGITLNKVFLLYDKITCKLFRFMKKGYKESK